MNSNVKYCHLNEHINVFQITKSVIALLRYFNWKIFAILFEDSSKQIAYSLRNEADRFKDSENKVVFNVSFFKSIQTGKSCCEKNLSCCSESYWYELLKETKAHTRSKFCCTTIFPIR